jgi:cell division protein FtsL
MKNKVLYIILAILIISLVGLYIYGKSQTQVPVVETNLENLDKGTSDNTNQAPANNALNQNIQSNGNNASNANTGASANKNGNANSNKAANNSNGESQGYYSNEVDLGTAPKTPGNSNK